MSEVATVETYLVLNDELTIILHASSGTVDVIYRFAATIAVIAVTLVVDCQRSRSGRVFIQSRTKFH
jgi:hypothetical protein